MPKKVPRNNPVRRSNRIVQGSAQSAASLLQRINRKGAGKLPAPQSGSAAALGQVRQLLPEELRVHLVEVLEKPGELVLFTDSAAWAGRLKLAASDLAEFAAGRRQVVRMMPRGEAENRPSRRHTLR
jgi:hypothetical protein